MKAKKRQTSRMETRLFWRYRSTTRVKLVINRSCLHFPYRCSAASLNTPRNVQTSCKISLAVLINVCSRLGQENSRKCKQTPSERTTPCTYLKYKVHMMLLGRAQMCIERVFSFQLRHHGGIIYMETPYVAQGTSVCDSSLRAYNDIHFGPVAREVRLKTGRIAGA